MWQGIRARQLFAYLGALVVVSLIGGCSGAGMPPAQVQNQTLQDLAAEHMTTVQLLRSWLTVLYPENSGPPGVPSLVIEQVDAHTWHAYGTDSLGQPLDYYSRDDGSGYGYWCSAPGVRVDGTWTPWVWTSATVMVQDIQYQYPDMRMSFRATCDYAAPGGNGMASVLEEGTATTAGGEQLGFRWFNNAVDRDQLHLELPAAHLTIELTVPFVFVVNVGNRPAPGQPAVGTMQTPAGLTNLSLTGNDCHWQHWELTAADGTTGSFTLGDQMSGSGQLTKGGVLQGALNWTGALRGRLDLMALGTAEVTPCAASRNLAIERWLSRAAGLGPGAIQ